MQIAICQSKNQRDTRMRDELLSHLIHLESYNTKIWSNASIVAGLNVIGETMQAILSSQIIIPLISIEWYHDILIREIEPIILAKYACNTAQVLPILLYPCSYSLSTMGNLPPINNKCIGEMNFAKRGEFWQFLCSNICNILGIQITPFHIDSVITEQYINDLYRTLKKHTNLHISITTGLGSGTYNHGLDGIPTHVLSVGNVQVQTITSTQAYIQQTERDFFVPFTSLFIIKEN